VDQQQVDIIGVEPAQRVLQAVPGQPASLIGAGHLGGDEDLVPRHAGAADALTDRHLVGVLGCGVDQSIAVIDALGQAIGQFVPLGEQGARTDQGNRSPVEERD